MKAELYIQGSVVQGFDVTIRNARVGVLPKAEGRADGERRVRCGM